VQNGGQPSTYVNENAFLEKWIPIVVHSPAFLADGVLMITFDESSRSPAAGDGSYTVFDGTACCNEPSGPNTQLPGRPELAATWHISITGSVGKSGGGRTGSVLVSPFIRPGTVSSVGYNHYATLRSVEDYFGLRISVTPLIRARSALEPMSSVCPPNATPPPCEGRLPSWSRPSYVAISNPDRATKCSSIQTPHRS
jgi:hypothetical protein